MSQQLELFIKAKDDTAAAFKAVQGNLDKTGQKAREKATSFQLASAKAKDLADNVGRVSTTLARSADAFGLSASALKTLDDVADVAELGFKGLTSNVKGFSTALLGPIAAAAAVGFAIGTLLNKFELVRKAADAVTGPLAKLAAMVGIFESKGDPKALEGIAEFSKKMAASNEEAVRKQVAGQKALGVSVEDLAKKYKHLSPAMKESLGLTDKQVDASKKSAAAMKKSAEEASKLADAFSGKTLLADIQKFNEAVAGRALNDAIIARAQALAKEADTLKVMATGLPLAFQQAAASLKNVKLQMPGLAGGLSPQTVKNIQQPFLDALNNLPIGQAGFKTRFADVLKQELENAAIATEEVKKKTIDWGAALQGVALFADMLGGPFGATVEVIGNIGREFENVSKMEEGAAKSAAKLQAVLNAVGQIGGLLASSTTPAVAKLGGALQGAAAGAKIGTAILPGWGTAIGAVGGAVFGFLSKAKKLREEMKKLKDSFVESMGGMEALKLKAGEAGISLDKMFQAKSAKDLEKAIDGIKSKLDTWDEANKELQAAIDKYGITVAELGPLWAQQEMDKRAADLIKEWKLLSAAGVDVNVLIAKMGPNLLEFVKQSIAAGTAIPEAMRPMIDQLIASGQLLDENGVAYTSAEDAGITYAKTMSEMFESLIEKIEAFVNALMGIKPPTIHIPVTYDDPGEPGRGRGGRRGEDGFARGAVVLPFVPRAANGIVSARPGGSPVIVGEGGQAELVAPVRALAREIGAAAAAAAGGGGPEVIQVILDGRVLAEAMVRRNRAGSLPIAAGSVRKG